MANSNTAFNNQLDTWVRRVSSAKPFLRWAGGKQPFLARYGGILPRFHGKYIDPFVGGGSVFFYLARRETRPFSAILGDINRQLIATFAAVKTDPEAVNRRLKVLQAEYGESDDKAAYYYRLREQFNGSRPNIDPASFIFINRTSWNGLFRVNQLGNFNVPYGAPKSAQIAPTQEELQAASAALAQASLRATSWESLISYAEPDDFVFLDPPYYSDLLKDDTKYQRNAFTLRHHRMLAEIVAHLAERKIRFVLTNSGEEECASMYKKLGLHLQFVDVPRSINSKIELRGSAREIIVTPPWMKLGDN